jgi:WhiB family redox-sensing transcriptional regulator
MVLVVAPDKRVLRPVADQPVEVRRPLAQLPCRAFDPDLWFSDAPAELELAKSLCGDCPVRMECLAGALDRAEPWGVWGGEIFERGAVVPRKRPRGRPRKEDLARDAALRSEALARTAAFVAVEAAA